MKEILRISHGMQRNGPLRDINLEVYRGEIVVVQGLAGSGIRTLLDLLSGKTGLDGGTIAIEEKQVPPHRIHSPLWTRIFVSTEGRNQAENLSLAENLEILHHPASYLRFFSARKAIARARKYFDQEGLDIDPEAAITQLSPEMQHALNLMQARMQHASLIVMDDMRSRGTESWDDELLARMRRMRRDGMSFLILSYRGKAFHDLADRTVTLSSGRDVYEQIRGEFTETSVPFFTHSCISGQIHACGVLETGPIAGDIASCLKRIREDYPDAWNREMRFPIPAGGNMYNGTTVLIPAESAEKLCGNLSVRDNILLPLAGRVSRIPLGYINPRIAGAAYRDCCRMAGIDPGIKTLGELSWIQRKILSIDRWRAAKPKAMVIQGLYYGLDSREIEQLRQYLIRLAETEIQLFIISDSMEILTPLCTRILRAEDGLMVPGRETAARV